MAVSDRCFFCKAELPADPAAFYIGPFGDIRLYGRLLRLMAEHDRTRLVWRWLTGKGAGRIVQMAVCQTDCQACRVERSLEKFSEEIYMAGGLLEAVTTCSIEDKFPAAVR